MSAEAPQYTRQAFQIDPGALRADAEARGVTGTLYILPHDEDSRCILLVNHRSATILNEAFDLATVRMLFGFDECDEYDLIVIPKHRGAPGAPVI